MGLRFKAFLAHEPLPFGENGGASGAGVFAGNRLHGAAGVGSWAEGLSEARQGQSPKPLANQQMLSAEELLWSKARNYSDKEPTQHPSLTNRAGLAFVHG